MRYRDLSIPEIEEMLRKQYIEAFIECDYNVSALFRMLRPGFEKLGLPFSRSTLGRRIKDYGIHPPDLIFHPLEVELVTEFCKQRRSRR